jgi:hypothetical protein
LTIIKLFLFLITIIMKNVLNAVIPFIYGIVVGCIICTLI